MIFRTSADVRVADRTHEWVERFLPPVLRPYARLARLDRPIGTWLLLLPCWWSVAMATGVRGSIDQSTLWLLVLFVLGATAMRGAGCTYNDIVDRDFDAQVERTSSRPIPSGQVSLVQAWAFLIFQCLIGLAVLLMLNRFAIAVAMVSLIIVVVYPFMKRVTYWPQLVLGFAFNWGVLVGWSAVLDGLPGVSACLLYAGGVVWTLAYDTIYAHQDSRDDVVIGLKSTALKFGRNTPAWLAGFFAVSLFLFAVAGYMAGAGMAFAVGLVGAGLHGVWQVWALDIDDGKVCLRLFRANRYFGLMIFAGLAVDAILVWHASVAY